MLLALFGAKQSNVAVSNIRRSGTRKPPHANRLSFDALEERMVLSQCAYWFPPPGQQVPAPPTTGAYSRPPVDITWTCQATNSSLVTLRGQGSATATDPTDPDLTLTTTIDVGETWSFAANAWNKTAQGGTRLEEAKKDIPDWQEDKTDLYVIVTSEESKIITSFSLHKVVFDPGLEVHTSANWVQHYDPADEFIIVSKIGDASQTKTPIPESQPNDGQTKGSLVLIEWSGPAQWTKRTSVETTRMYAFGVKTSDLRAENTSEKSFVNYTDANPTTTRKYEETRHDTWYVSGKKRATEWQFNETVMNHVIPFETTRKEKESTTWFDNQANSVEKDHRDMQYIVNGDVNDPLDDFSRTTTYRTDGRPETFDWKYTFSPDWDTISHSMFLEWDVFPIVEGARLDGDPFPFPLNDADKVAIQNAYVFCRQTEAQLFFGTLTQYGYPYYDGLRFE